MTKLVVVNPRGMHFGEQRATSIDLSIRDLIRHSRFAASTTVVGDPIDKPFEGIAYKTRSLGIPDNFYFRMRRLLPVILQMTPDVISVQEHLGTAGYLAKKLAAPVLLHLHNPVRQPKNTFERLARGRALNRLAGLLFVSHDHMRSFQNTWPNVTVPRFVVPNALDMVEWKPEAERRKAILVVGRAIPEKRILEAAKALAQCLPRFPDWRGVFILSAVSSNKDYTERVRSALSAIASRVEILEQRPISDVKAWMERAAIAIVSSTIRETFGRTALEAHAGGAAVISSGHGGLREVSGDNALYLDDVEPESISKAIERLITDEPLRTRLAASGHAHAVANFDIRTIAAACDGIYERVIAQKSGKTV
ncbi:MAG: glycosyltransferase family 4 protein [Xanthobacteraceae bacterium]|nr:glycosyltransferase family 4 protein [Xanthobacteraceae bacterium]